MLALQSFDRILKMPKVLPSATDREIARIFCTSPTLLHSPCTEAFTSRHACLKHDLLCQGHYSSTVWLCPLPTKNVVMAASKTLWLTLESFREHPSEDHDLQSSEISRYCEEQEMGNQVRSPLGVDSAAKYYTTKKRVRFKLCERGFSISSYILLTSSIFWTGMSLNTTRLRGWF